MNFPEGPQEDLLGQIFGFRLIGRHPDAQIAYSAAMQAVKLTYRGSIPILGPVDEF